MIGVVGTYLMKCTHGGFCRIMVESQTDHTKPTSSLHQADYKIKFASMTICLYHVYNDVVDNTMKYIIWLKIILIPKPTSTNEATGFCDQCRFDHPDFGFYVASTPNKWDNHSNDSVYNTCI